MTRVGVIGLGAIGGWIAARLALAGLPVTAFCRGATLQAVQQRGLTLVEECQRNVSIHATDCLQELMPQDLVVIAVKAPALRSALPAIVRMLGDDTVILPLLNGVPWWFGPSKVGVGLEAVDPDGRIAEALALPRILGAVVHASCESPRPGEIRRNGGNRLIIGDPSGRTASRTQLIADLLASASFDVTIAQDIHDDVMFKLLGNMTLNPISALTRAMSDEMLDSPLVAALIERIMVETMQIAESLGCKVPGSVAERNAEARRLGSFKTSMLQDVERLADLEIEAMLGAPKELALHLGISTPNLDGLLGLTRLFANAGYLRLQKAALSDQMHLSVRGVG